MYNILNIDALIDDFNNNENNKNYYNVNLFKAFTQQINNNYYYCVMKNYNKKVDIFAIA